MRLSVNEDGNVQIDLDPDDEQITINIGPAEVLCFGGTIANPGTGPLVQAEVEYHNVRVGTAYLEVQFSPLKASDES